MRPMGIFVTIRTAVTGAFLVLCFSQTAAQTHPRLLFAPSDIADVRAKKDNEPFSSMLAAIEDGALNATEGNSDYTHDMRAVNAAFLYVVTANAAWADSARSHVEPVIDGSQWATNSARGLALDMNGKSVALAFDMCYDAWSGSFRDRVSTALKQHADIITDSGGTGQNPHPASNWQGNRFSAAGLCYLATDDSYDAAKLDSCWRGVVRYCRENLGDDPASRGWNIEGIGYTLYPFGQFTGAFGIAMARADAQRDVREEMESVKWTPWTVYANGCAIAQQPGEIGIHPDFGDDNHHLSGEGTYGLAFYYCHEELMPGLRYWYDRIEGSKADGNYDRHRHGAIYSYLYYPNEVTEQQPLTIAKWREGFIDTGGNGYFTYRNRYQDKDDLVAQIHLKRRGNKGHNGPDALSFRIYGLDTPFGVGGGRYGPRINGHHAYWSSMNTLYPMDPESAGLVVHSDSGEVVGTPYLDPNGSGHVVSRIDRNNLGVDNHTRWFAADYSQEAGVDAVYVVGDVSDNGTYWQMCTLESQEVTVDEVSKTFTIAGANGSSLKGHILYQRGDIALTSGTRIRGSTNWYKGVEYDENNYVHFRSSDGDYVVVLTAAASGQTHPTVAFAGEGVVGGEVSVGPCKYGFEPEGVRYGDVGVGNRGRAGVLTRDRFVTRRDGWLELYVQRQDAYTVRVYDVSGRMVHALDGVGPGTYRIPMRVMSDGAYVVDVR